MISRAARTCGSLEACANVKHCEAAALSRSVRSAMLVRPGYPTKDDPDTNLASPKRIRRQRTTSKGINLAGAPAPALRLSWQAVHSPRQCSFLLDPLRSSLRTGAI